MDSRDETMIEDLSILPIMKTNKDDGEDPGLETICLDVFRIILMYLGLREKGLLREVSSTLRWMIDECDNMCKYWRFATEFSTARLIRFSNEVGTVLGLEVLDATDDGVKHLVKKHPEIKNLNLSFSNITGERILHCSETPLVVENLDLTECKQITNKGLLQILQLCGNTLKSLSLQGTSGTGENLAHLMGGLPRLEILNLMSCKQLTDAGLLVILHLSKHTLRSLNIGHTDITGDNLAAYNIDLPCLEILNLESCNNLTDKGFQLFLQIFGKSVKSLNLVHTNITGEYIPEYDEALPCLEKLNLTYCNQLTDRGLQKILERCRDSLEYLELGWTGITGENMTEFTGTLRRVEYLNLTCCQHLTNRGLGQMLNLCCRRLKSLNLVKTKISGENLTGLEGYLPCLESLNLSNCPRLTDQGLICFLRMCGSTLTTLSMGGTHFTGEHFKDFNQTLPLLKSLSLIGCGKLTPNGLLYLLKLCERRKLRYLYLAHCTKLGGYFRHKVQRLYLGVKVYY